jgi:hypothetical protein
MLLINFDITCKRDKDEKGDTYSTHGEKRNAYKILSGKPDGTKQQGRPRHR